MGGDPFRGVPAVGIAVLLALLVVDAATSLVYRTGTDAHLEVSRPRSGVPRRVIVAAPGHAMSGGSPGAALATAVRDDDVVVAISYAQRGLDADAVYRELRRALDATRPAEVLFSGGSLGGLVTAAPVERYLADGLPFGRGVVLDSAPAQESDIRHPTCDIRRPTSDVRHPTSDVRTGCWRSVAATPRAWCRAWVDGRDPVRRAARARTWRRRRPGRRVPRPGAPGWECPPSRHGPASSTRRAAIDPVGTVHPVGTVDPVDTATTDRQPD